MPSPRYWPRLTLHRLDSPGRSSLSTSYNCVDTARRSAAAAMSDIKSSEKRRRLLNNDGDNLKLLFRGEMIAPSLLTYFATGKYRG